MRRKIQVARLSKTKTTVLTATFFPAPQSESGCLLDKSLQFPWLSVEERFRIFTGNTENRKAYGTQNVVKQHYLINGVGM
jgi:hypothetical protein